MEVFVKFCRSSDINIIKGGIILHCKKCGVAFSESDIEMILEDNEEPICDECIILGDMTLDQMVNEIRTVMRPFLKEFIKDCYDHRHDEPDENVLELLDMIKKRYIKNAPLH